MKKKIKIVFTILSLVFPIACASLPFPTDQSLQRVSRKWPQITLADLQIGRKNYVSHCAACHNLFFPSAYSPAEWNKILVQMQKKAKIDDGTTDSIRVFLSSMTAKPEKSIQ